MPGGNDGPGFLNRISIRRNQVVAMESHDQELEDLDIFQKNTAERFADLLPPPTPAPGSVHSSTPKNNGNSDQTPSSISASESPLSEHNPLSQPAPAPLLSIEWFRKLLDVFLCCEAEYKAVIVMGRDPCQFNKPPLDRLIPDLLDRSIKALDVCNAVTNGVELVRHWQRLAQIAVVALEQRPIGEGQVRRAKKALSTLLTSMAFDDKENGGVGNNNHGKSTERTWSFGRRGGGGSAAGNSNKDRTGGTFRSLSWSMAKSWSAAKQIQAMSANLIAPRGVEANGLAMPVYIMCTVLVFVMWSLVAAFPCQERNGLSTHIPVPKQLGWAHAITGLQEKIAEEWKKKEKKGTAGLLEEIQRMEKLAQSLIEFSDAFQFPLEDEKVDEVAVQVAELADICRKMEEGLAPLQQQVREVFHRIVRSRAEVLDVIDQVGKMSVPVPY
ncbi:OLC1v1029841C1 [Oldenlandia corymbosa var. corymbosa]|uniref:OLC1v1029841C1 n=1 Tax=Oldenlandia corymbosa var. corymbosa TaxID=529605 RepID=A0AAV1CI03_OLDCO|nr:OLC1v1029841C1 [Oldenlandia corymbosa var. corymbosa]